jgi:hypothetical protein
MAETSLQPPTERFPHELFIVPAILLWADIGLIVFLGSSGRARALDFAAGALVLIGLAVLFASLVGLLNRTSPGISTAARSFYTVVHAVSLALAIAIVVATAFAWVRAID